MSKLQHNVWLRSVKLLAVLCMTLPFAACWYGYYTFHVAMPLEWSGKLVVVLLYAALYIALGNVYEAFQISSQKIASIVFSQMLAAMIADGLIYLLICLLAKRFCSLIPGIAAIAGQLVVSALWAFCAQKWYYKTFPPLATAIVYDMRPGIEEMIHEDNLEKKYNVKITLDIQKCLKNMEVLRQMDVVFLGGIHSHERNKILKYCVEHDIDVFVLPRVGDLMMDAARPTHMFHLSVLKVGRSMASPEYLFIKRAMDIVLSLIALLISSPIFLIISAAIKATDGGPVFYKQCRLTKDGRRFDIIKFRSMKVDAEKDGVARLSTGEADDRITPVGRVIRKFRLDELPQLINILKGDLSICGPRPERPEIAAQYCETLPEFALRLQVKAGLTGYAQIYGKYNTSPYDKLQMDLMYIAHQGILEDLKLMLATVKVLFIPESTEGITEGETTAMGQDYPKDGTMV